VGIALLLSLRTDPPERAGTKKEAGMYDDAILSTIGEVKGRKGGQ